MKTHFQDLDKWFQKQCKAFVAKRNSIRQFDSIYVTELGLTFLTFVELGLIFFFLLGI